MTKPNATFFILPLIVLLVLPATAQTTYTRLPSVELPASLDRVLRDYETAWRDGQGEKLADLFTEPGFVHADAGWVRGRQAIQHKYASTGGDLRLRALDFDLSDSIGYIVGAYGYGDTASDSDLGTFVLVLRKTENGKWLIVADLDKSNSISSPSNQADEETEQIQDAELMEYVGTFEGRNISITGTTLFYHREGMPTHVAMKKIGKDHFEIVVPQGARVRGPQDGEIPTFLFNRNSSGEVESLSLINSDNTVLATHQKSNELLDKEN